MTPQTASLRWRRWGVACGFWLFLLGMSVVARPIAEALRTRNLLRFTLAAAAALCMGWIIWVARRQRPLRWTFWGRLVVWGVLYILVGRYLMVAPEEQVHLLDMGVLTYLVYRALQMDLRSRWVALGIAGVLGCLAGAATENLQRCIPGRQYTLPDVGLNCLSVLLALGVIATVLDRGRNYPCVDGGVRGEV